jgi:hypothetical protein
MELTRWQDDKNPQPAIELHIEALVLHGFSPADRARIATAIERELARLFVEQGPPLTWAQGGATARLDGGSLHVAPHAGVEAIGVQVAQALYKGLSQEGLNNGDQA